MTRPARARLFVAAAATALVTAAPAHAAPVFALITRVEEGQSNLFDWFAPFSVWRWVIFALVAVPVAWFVAFHIIMLNALALGTKNPPRPKEAFAWAAACFVVFAAAGFDLAFAVACNDLYYKPWVKWFPSPMTPLNYHLPWVAVLAGGLLLGAAARYVFRR